MLLVYKEVVSLLRWVSCATYMGQGWTIEWHDFPENMFQFIIIQINFFCNFVFVVGPENIFKFLHLGGIFCVTLKLNTQAQKPSLTAQPLWPSLTFAAVLLWVHIFNCGAAWLWLQHELVWVYPIFLQACDIHVQQMTSAHTIRRSFTQN